MYVYSTVLYCTCHVSIERNVTTCEHCRLEGLVGHMVLTHIATISNAAGARVPEDDVMTRSAVEARLAGALVDVSFKQ